MVKTKPLMIVPESESNGFFTTASSVDYELAIREGVARLR
jgi:hypothetical protein